MNSATELNEADGRIVMIRNRDGGFAFQKFPVEPKLLVAASVYL